LSAHTTPNAITKRPTFLIGGFPRIAGHLDAAGRPERGAGQLPAYEPLVGGNLILCLRALIRTRTGVYNMRESPS
jgi:hypothetical protein